MLATKVRGDIAINLYQAPGFYETEVGVTPSPPSATTVSSV